MANKDKFIHIFKEEHCPKCGGYMRCEGYYFIVCDNCKYTEEYIWGNRASVGRDDENIHKKEEKT